MRGREVVGLGRAVVGGSLDDRTSAGGASDGVHAAHTAIASPRAKGTTRVMFGAFIML
jgi:hypothetical protein